MKNKIILLLTILFSIQFTNAQVEEYFHVNGQLASVGEWNSSGKTGQWKSYYENGKLKSIGKYEYGREIGRWKYYHENGQLKEIGECVYTIVLNGRTGEWKSYYENGRLMNIGEYDTGGLGDYFPRKGEWKYYHEDGELMQIGSFKNGRKTNEWNIYHNNTSLYQTRLFKDGKLMDIISCFDNKGNPLNKGTLINGKGTVNEYDENGKLTKTIKYYNGKSYR